MAEKGARKTKDKTSKRSVAQLALRGPGSAATVSHSLKNEKVRDAEPFVVTRDLNRLSDESSATRRQAALALERHFLSNDVPDDVLDPALFAEMAKPLFKRFNDSVEKVREVCVRVTTKFVARQEDLLSILPYLMPAITRRIQSQWSYDEENQVFTRDQFVHDAFKRGRIAVDADQVRRVKPSEPSEEIRLLLLQLIDALLTNAFERRASSILHAYVFDMLLLLVAAVHDDFHEIKIASCALLREISKHMVSVMKHFTVAFVRAVKPLLHHRLARVRLAGLDCIQWLVVCPNVEKCKGSGTDAIVDLLGHRDENVIPIAAFYTPEVRLNSFAKLDQDANPQVRRAFYAMVQYWMKHLPDRYDHESRLMPYLLSAVTDELEETSRDARETLAALGRMHEAEQGEEVLEMKQYGLDGRNPSFNYSKRLPPPFLDDRPSLGTRLFVRSRTRRFLNPILRELENWQSPTRAHAVRLLKTVLVYSEEHVTVDAHALIDTLLRVWDDDELQRQPKDNEGRSHLQDVADLTGRFVAPKTYMPLVLARLHGETAVVGQIVTPEMIATTLEVLYFLMDGSLDSALLPHAQEVVEAVSGSVILEFQSPRLNTALARLLHQLASLLKRRGRDTVSAYFLEHGRLTSLELVYQRLFEAAMIVRQRGINTATKEADGALQTLSDAEGLGDEAQLMEVHFDASFDRAAATLVGLSDVQWAPTRPEQLLIDALVTCSGVVVLTSSEGRTTRVLDCLRRCATAQDGDDARDTPRLKANKRLLDHVLQALQTDDAQCVADQHVSECARAATAPLGQADSKAAAA
ncbi:hypothetical protein ATCC90586_001237 [Pythium insidiosum]|nr:hypothetical protein ATCC90586_001237 [Pythium insidiosum]